MSTSQKFTNEIAARTGWYGYHVGRTSAEHGPSIFFRSTAAAEKWESNGASRVLVYLTEGDCQRWLDADITRMAKAGG